MWQGQALTDELVRAYTGGEAAPITTAITGIHPPLRECMNAAIAAGIEPDDTFFDLPNADQARIIALYRINGRIAAMQGWWQINRPGAKR